MEATQLSLLQPTPWTGIEVSSRCQLHQQGDTRIAVVDGMPMYSYAVEDKAAEELWVAQCYALGYATVKELCRALDYSGSKVHRLRARYQAGGMEALRGRKRGPKGPWRLGKRETLVRRWHKEELSAREMAKRLGVSPWTVLAALKRLGLAVRKDAEAQLVLDPTEQETQGACEPCGPGETEAPQEQGGGLADDVGEPAAEALDLREATAEALDPSEATPLAETVGRETARTMDSDPLNREGDRLMARLGLLEDAAPLFADARGVPQAGVLLAIPVLVRSGLVETGEQVYGSIGPAFYGLRTMLVAFVVYALLRIKRAEHLKEHQPQSLGQILGLDRAPEVKTMRRKLRKLAEDERAETFLERLRERRAAAGQEALGYLYVDGHVRVYHGKHAVPKTHSCRLRMSLPATQDVWLNDADATPVLVVTQTAHPQLVSALPAVLKQVRPLVGERRVTVVFDRGGWSPKLFAQMHQDGFDILTYQKGEQDPIPIDQFRSYTVCLAQGPVTYELYEQPLSLLDGTFSLRQVIRRQGDHQTVVVTTRWDLPIEEVARRMFARWGQENFFKYMRQEFALDALVEYGAEPDDPDRSVPNPARKRLERQVCEAKQALLALEAHYGAAAFDKAHSNGCGTTDPETELRLHHARQQLAQLRAQRAEMPTRIPVAQLPTPSVRLLGRCKRFSDALKMLSYQVETDLLRVVALLYPRSREEGRRLLVAAFHSPADLAVTKDELRVTLSPQSSPHRTQVIAALCELLTDTQTLFPGTSLKLRFAIHPTPSSASSRPGG